MNVAIFGGLGRSPFSPGWTKETVIAILGGIEVKETAPTVTA